MLQMQGHTVSGISLKPTEKSLFNQAHLSNIFENDLRIDIRNSKELAETITKIAPEVIIHLAAQPLVRESYKDPVGTFETNVLGTLNLLEATRGLTRLKASLIITTDKVYKNKNHLRGYIETDEIGGDDPYSASKAAADIATQSWVKNFAQTPIAIARAGNVIGGGDWATDRIVPDLVAAFSRGEILKLRHPMSIRPWHHVLDCLNGYLELINYQLQNNVGGEWNFGPAEHEKYTVAELAAKFAFFWGRTDQVWEKDSNSTLKETYQLILNSSKARKLLSWSEKLTFTDAVEWTVAMYKNHDSQQNVMQKQIYRYLSM